VKYRAACRAAEERAECSTSLVLELGRAGNYWGKGLGARAQLTLRVYRNSALVDTRHSPLHNPRKEKVTLTHLKGILRIGQESDCERNH
jgi:hypothetical protein